MKKSEQNRQEEKKQLKNYNPPVLKEFGTIKDLTAGSAGSVADGASGSYRV